MTTWVTFVPCFLWIFLGAPHLERLRRHVRLAGALSAVTAAVVKMGDVLRTTRPVPVSSLITPANWADVVAARAERLFVV
jgi:hypothetical protein